MVYDIHFKRLPIEPSMDLIMRRPYADEIEDYKEYKRLRQVYRDKAASGAKAKKYATTPILKVSMDGTVSIREGEAAGTPFQHHFTDKLQDDVSSRGDEVDDGGEYRREF